MISAEEATNVGRGSYGGGRGCQLWLRRVASLIQTDGGLHLNLAKTVAWGHKCRFICGTRSWQKVWASSTPG